jgi:hypothetical protein
VGISGAPIPSPNQIGYDPRTEAQIGYNPYTEAQIGVASKTEPLIRIVDGPRKGADVYDAF